MSADFSYRFKWRCAFWERACREAVSWHTFWKLSTRWNIYILHFPDTCMQGVTLSSIYCLANVLKLTNQAFLNRHLKKNYSAAKPITVGCSSKWSWKSAPFNKTICLRADDIWLWNLSVNIIKNSTRECSELRGKYSARCRVLKLHDSHYR